MKKLFGILGSVVLCAVMACVALTGCGDKTAWTRELHFRNLFPDATLIK